MIFRLSVYILSARTMLRIGRVPCARSSDVITTPSGDPAILEVTAATIKSSPRRLWEVLDSTTTGLRFCELRSVNGTGTSNRSLCSGVIPDFVVNAVVPEVKAAFTR